ncbi:sigma-70 family RNA polymerase sigma factor [Akkermansiaceae bacterium]|nr:sigma-70 family RNA polymerase sigma factor [Akkermansiaceae bacterium]
MPDSLNTRQTLLLKIRDSNDTRSWSEFVEIYTPLLYNYFVARGLSDADAADLGQEVMRSVAKAIARFDYDPNKGTFRSWLYTISRNHLNNFFKKNARQPKGSGRTTILNVVNQIEDESADMETHWELEHRRRLFEWAAAQIRGNYEQHSWEAFERVALHQEDAASVADSLNMKLGAVYVAKSRITAKLRELIESIAGEWPELPQTRA